MLNQAIDEKRFFAPTYYYRSTKKQIDQFIQENFDETQLKNWHLIKENIQDERFKKAIWCCEYKNYGCYSAFHTSAISRILPMIGYLSAAVYVFSPLFFDKNFIMTHPMI